MNPETADRSATSALCAICQTPLGPTENEPTTSCPACGAKYHADCWLQNGGCAVYGCAQVPTTEGRAGIEIPVGYWGQEHKPCPVCNAQILAAALRCRHCGTVFRTTRPLGSAEFSRAASQEAQSPRVRRNVLWLFILCLIPFSAPIAAVVGLIWLQSNYEHVEKLPSLYAALAKIGVGVGLFQTAAILLLALVFTLLRS